MHSGVRYNGRKIQHRNVQRRLQEWENAEQHAANYGYFKKMSLITKQHRLWEEADSPGSMYVSRLKEEERKRRLAIRRDKLAALLMEENLHYETELKNQQEMESMERSFNLSQDINRLRGINSEIRRREEDRRSREAELRLYHRWRSEQPLLKSIEDKHRTEFVRKAWVDQVEEKLAEEKKKAEEEEAYQAERKSKLAMQEELEKTWLEEQQIRMTELKNSLQCQVDLLRKKEQQTQELQELETLMIQQESELEKLSQRRREVEKKRHNIETGLYLQEHYNLKLKRRAKEVQESLEEDKRLMRELEKQLVDPKLVEEERRETRRIMDRANSVLASYSEMEKLMEKDMHAMFHEDARFFWEKQEKRWKEEQEARNQLMADTLATLQLQIRERAEQARAKQESLLQEQEELLRQLEESNTELEKSQGEVQKRQSFKRCLDAQVEDKAAAKLAEIRLQEKDREARLEEMKREEERLLQEFKRLNAKQPSYPLNFGRKTFIPC